MAKCEAKEITEKRELSKLKERAEKNMYKKSKAAEISFLKLKCYGTKGFGEKRAEKEFSWVTEARMPRP